MTYFDEERAITLEATISYGSFLNLIKSLKGASTLKACEFEIQALIKPCDLSQTRSKSDIKIRKLEQFNNQNSDIY